MTEAPLELCLPARRGSGEEGMLRAVDVGVLPALGIDAQLERGTLPAIQQAEAVAQPVVLPRLGRPEAALLHRSG